MSMKLQCPDCGTEMEEGFIPDWTQGGVLQTCWHRGTAESKTFLGMQMGGVKYDPTNMMPVTACRCTSCGLLKFYATPKAEK